MWLLAVTALLMCWHHAGATMVYGHCPRLMPISYEDFHIKPFEDDNGVILYFSNVRFEALLDGREIEERYLSHYAIVLEQQGPCFRPFQLQKKKNTWEYSLRSFHRDSKTFVNVIVLAMHEKNYLLAFSCVQVGHNKLEYLWIFGRAGRFGIGLEKVRQMFEPWLANMSTPVMNLRSTHHDLPFCKSIVWPLVVGGIVASLTLLIVTTGTVCLKKHKQMLRLRRSSCAEYPMEELEYPNDLQATDARRIRSSCAEYPLEELEHTDGLHITDARRVAASANNITVVRVPAQNF